MIRRETNVVAKANGIPKGTRGRIGTAQALAQKGDHVASARMYLEIGQFMLDTDDFRRAEEQYRNAAAQATKAANSSLILR